jgi:hypothetical protein
MEKDKSKWVISFRHDAFGFVNIVMENDSMGILLTS